MSNGPIRRSHLIAPFGVGALYVGRDGVSLISAGLDHWFEKEDGSTGVLEDEFKIKEWRLERSIGVDHFRMPADFRRPQRGQADVPNAYLYQPFLRFPRWHFCQHCHVLKERPLTEHGRIFCHSDQSAAHKGKNRPMYQVPYVAICSKGHIQDLPWREWAHRSLTPSCDHPMRLLSKGSAGLSGEWVECGCGASRSLGAIMNADRDSGLGRLSTLVAQDDGTEGGPPYLCKGHRPWLGTEEQSDCGEQLRGALRGASNVYFPNTRSSIYIPRWNDTAPSELVALMEEQQISSIFALTAQFGTIPDANMLRTHAGDKLINYTNEQINAAIGIVSKPGNNGQDPENTENSEEDPNKFRRDEFTILKEPKKEKDLEIRSVDISAYGDWVSKYFSRILLIDKLRETRALIGFTRIFEEIDISISDMKNLLRAKQPTDETENWLPAYVVFGEGILFAFHERAVAEWERSSGVGERLDRLIQRYNQAQSARHIQQKLMSSRFVLLHTFAHVLMNNLTFECGYGSAALRERLYVSNDPGQPMAGVLIYTASGDADGTMGGLVRMGRPGYLEPVIRNAIDNAGWCSADPVCMEIGARGGQGPDSCNLAACHNCALVPETACEEFNKLLDRATLIGALGSEPSGFFS